MKPLNPKYTAHPKEPIRQGKETNMFMLIRYEANPIPIFASGGHLGVRELTDVGRLSDNPPLSSTL